MAGKQGGEKERYWEDMLNRQAASGLSIRRFCAKQGISQPSFYAWRRRLRAEKNDVSPATLQPGGCEPSSVSDFIPLKMVQATGTVEIVHPDGCRVRVSGEVDVPVLLHVLEALDRRSGR